MPLGSLACMLMALPLLGSLVRGGTWWVPAFVMMVAVAGVSALYRLSGWNAFPVPFLQAFAAAFLVTPLFAGHIAPLGLLPTDRVLAHLVMVFEQGANTVNGNAPPVSSSAGVMLIIALAFTVLTFAADFLAVTARCPGMVGCLLLALVSVPLLVDGSGLGWLPAAACAIGFLMLLAMDMWVRGHEWGTRVAGGHGSRERVLGAVRSGVAVSLASAVAVLLALTVPLALPSLRTDALHTMADGTYVGTGGDLITTTHPLVSLRRELAFSDRTVLTYRTDTDQPDYLRTYVLDEFDGVNWTMTPVNASADSRVAGELPLPTGWGSAPSEDVVTTRISLDSETPRMDFLPLPYWARAVRATGEWYVDPRSHVVFTTDSAPTGLNFTVETVDRVPTAEELADTGNPRSLPGDYRNLPRGLDPRVQELTDSLTEGAQTPYERAVALQEYFTGGAFTYDLDPPAVPDGTDPLVHFLLGDRVGYCEQFAGAMTVMARQAGVPARVAVGYTAGERMGDGRWAVSSGDAHAWPELYFEGAGWVRFEPTPAAADGQGSASVPDYSRGSEEDGADAPGTVPEEPEAPADEASERSEEGGAPGEEPSRAPEESEEPEDEPTSSVAAPGDGSRTGTGLAWLPVAGAAAVGLLLLALPALVRALVRWSRTAALSAGAAGASQAHTAWRELRDTCLDLGGTWTLTESPRAAAGRLARSGAAPETAEPEPGGLMSGAPPGPVSPETAEALWRLALAEESARYAPSPDSPEGLREDLRTALAGLAAVVGPGARVRAVLLPRSLAPWRRPRPAPVPGTVTP
ncbi:DUF3488 and transglutaminase-like domain-containing protein [Nocardiopsis quinghaiensis]|uniref:DUF3488 and transglutaminase-like domain-containing protein n=1 Tax=Nocardiopsis quinghaiensis TaxID=464995 RepID=UPI00123A2A69|nr:DUF3488 and transglutaminase-like domain-containing protein [Nocardiopsis quinghaiensis]